jgi:hypothetical protein
VLEQKASSGDIGSSSRHSVACKGEVIFQRMGRIMNVAAILPEALRYPESCSLEQTDWYDILGALPSLHLMRERSPLQLPVLPYLSTIIYLNLLADFAHQDSIFLQLTL